MVAALSSAGVYPCNRATGVATGLAVLDDLIGSGEAEEREIVGETPICDGDTRYTADNSIWFTEEPDLARGNGSARLLH